MDEVDFSIATHDPANLSLKWSYHVQHFVSSNALANRYSAVYDVQLFGVVHVPAPAFITFVASVYLSVLHSSGRGKRNPYADIASCTVYT